MIEYWEENLHVLDRPGLIKRLDRISEVFNSLPEKFELVILPDGDPEMCLYNMELLNAYGSEGKPVVFARIQSDQENADPSLYVPIAA